MVGMNITQLCHAQGFFSIIQSKEGLNVKEISRDLPYEAW
jgi:hypothetical protein